MVSFASVGISLGRTQFERDLHLVKGFRFAVVFLNTSKRSSYSTIHENEFVLLISSEYRYHLRDTLTSEIDEQATHHRHPDVQSCAPP